MEKPELERNLRAVNMARQEFDPEAQGFLPVPLAYVLTGRNLHFSLYIPRLSGKEKSVYMSQVVEAGHPLLQRNRDVLQKAGFSRLFMPQEDLEAYLEHSAQFGRDYLKSAFVAEKDKAEFVFHQASMVVRHSLSGSNLKTSLEMGRQLVGFVLEHLVHTPAGLKSLCQVLASDSSLPSHAVNVCFLTTGFVHHLGLKPEETATLALGSLFHDLGMGHIPPEIRDKQGELLPGEWEEVKKHPLLGYQLLRHQPGLAPDVLRLAYQHHENLDGSGYPRGLKGGQIAVAAQIARVVDTYDAMTSRRSHHQAGDPSQALKVMALELKAQLSPRLINAFMLFLGKALG